MIRWLGGLIRDDIKPDRPNQIVLTNSHSNDKRLRRAVALDIPILQYECLDKLWAMKDDDSFKVTETFKSTYKIKALQDCLIYFHGLNDSEINLTHERTRQLEGEVALSIDEPAITHVIMEQPYDRELLQKIVDNDLLKTIQVLRLEWFWESVKADTQALEENHTIDVFQVLNDSERVHGKKTFVSKLSESAVSREKLLSQIAKESREEEHEINDLVLPGYSRRDRYKASPESRRTSHSNNSLLSKPNVSALVFDKSIDRNTDYSHADSDDQTIQEIKKASSCPLIDQIEATASRKTVVNDDLATSTPARSRRSLSSQASSLRGSREKSLDNLSNSSKRKITEQRSEISATESSESKISRKNTILQSNEELNTPKIVHIDDNGIHRLITKEESLQLEQKRLDNSPPLSRKGSRKYTDLPQLKTIEKNSEKKKSKRYMIIEELFTVETQYLKTLNFIVKEFKLPLEQEAKLPEAEEDFDTDHDTTSVISLSNNLSPNPGQGTPGTILPLARVRSIFGHIDLIYEVHCALFEELQEFIVNWNPENSIGEMMKKYAEDFKRVYPPFLSYFPQIKAELDECTKLYHRFAAHIMLAERKRSDRSKLIDLMIQPVQRLMRYPLIFQRLKSTTQKECAMSHPDNICLEAVTKLFENVSSMVNESKRKTEDYQAMLHLTQKIERFPPNLVSASRQFIQEIDCYYRSSLNVKKKATLFMFNDYIIVCTRQRLHTFSSKINRKRYSFYEQINMHHIIPTYQGQNHASKLLKLDPI